MGQQAFESYVAPARERSGVGRLILGLIVIVAGWIGWTALVMGVWVALEVGSGRPVPEAVELLGAEFMSGTPRSIALMLATFIGIWPAVWLVVRVLHRRPFATLLSPERRVRWGELGYGLGLAALLWLVGSAVAVLLVGAPHRSELALGSWAVWLVPLALLVFAQAAGEELIFRGYVLQQLAARWRSPLVWAVLPALVFGLAHFSPDRAPLMNAVYVAATLVFGLIAAVLVWRTGSLAAAMGVHAGNNFGAICLTGLEGVASGSQLWVHQAAYKEALIVVDLVLMTALLAWLVSPACPRRLRAAG